MTAGPLYLGVVRGLAAAFLVAMMLGMGLALGGEPAPDRAGKRRKRRVIVRALVLNLVLLPLVAVALTHAFDASDEVAVALLLLAAAPGGRFAPQLAKLAGAELALSVEITLFLAKLVAFTAPVTARWLLHTHHLEIHELPFIVQLVGLQLLPYVLGRQVRKRRPALAAGLRRPVNAIVWTCLTLLALVMASRLDRVATLVGARGWWPVLAFAVAAPALGWLVGGPGPAARRAVAVSANARDVALASMLATLAFAGGGVHLATLAVWALLLVADLVFVRLVARRPTGGAAVRPLQPQPTGGAS